jgi:hypothetical protein
MSEPMSAIGTKRTFAPFRRSVDAHSITSKRAARPAPAKRVQIFNDRATLFVGIPQTSQFAL